MWPPRWGLKQRTKTLSRETFQQSLKAEKGNSREEQEWGAEAVGVGRDEA